MSCPLAARTRALLDARRDDTIGRDESRELKAHLAGCAPCAERARAEDPTLLFAPLASEPPARRGASSEASEARRMAADVLAAVEVERLRRRLGAPHRRFVLRAASVAVLAGALATLVHVTRPAPAPEPAAAPAVAAAPESEGLPAPLVIDELKNPGATVFQFASTSVQEPNVVFVVDRNADI